MLSEILHVPATIETGSTAQASFYQPDNRFEYGPSNEPEVLENGNALGDCRLANTNYDDKDSYTPCAHAILESFPHDDPVFSRENGQAGWEYFIRDSLKSFLEQSSD